MDAKARTLDPANAIASHPDWRIEYSLLMAAARMDLSSTQLTTLFEQTKGQVNWHHTLSLAASHGITPLLYQAVQGVPTVPNEVQDRLHRVYMGIAQKNMWLTAELLALIDRFAAQGIILVPYKGPILAQMAYDNLSLREFKDLDVLVRENDVHKAQTLLVDQDFYPWKAPAPEDAETAFRKRPVQRFIHRQRPIAVDLHWGATYKRSFDFPFKDEQFWRRLQTFSMSGRNIQVVPPEEMLQFLCLHGSRHQGERLIWIRDVAQFVHAHPHMAWDRCLTLATQAGNQRMLLIGLQLAHDLMGIDLPASVHAAIQSNPLVASLVRPIWDRWLFRPAATGIVHKLSVHRYLIQIHGRWQDRVPVFIDSLLGTPWRWIGALPDRLSARAGSRPSHE
ncbi:MAG: nucleotidyltransferase family protein [Caldilineaceae bacterium]|nr:nucleotidyltransferase family protein [Caldilineaceae bacterium]